MVPHPLRPTRQPPDVPDVNRGHVDVMPGPHGQAGTYYRGPSRGRKITPNFSLAVWFFRRRRRPQATCRVYR